MAPIRRSHALCLVLFATTPAFALQVQITQLSFQATAISSDGNVLVGTAPGTQAVRWSLSGGVVGLGFLPGGDFSVANGVSRDGSVVVGSSGASTPLMIEAFIWTAASGMLGLGTLPGSTRSDAYAVSLDGAVVVGTCSGPGSQSQGFHWTAATGMVGLGGFPGQPLEGYARATNADGSVIVGWSKMGAATHAYRWTAQSGLVSLGVAPGYTSSYAEDVSADGTVVVGGMARYPIGSERESFKWTPSGGMVPLGDLPGWDVDSRATDVSDSGLVIVGYGVGYFNYEAVLWSPLQGPASLGYYVYSHGGNWSQWPPAAGVSADGLRMISTGGSGPSSWLIAFPPPWTTYCTAKDNSIGCTPAISAMGVPSASNAWTFKVMTYDLLNQKVGL